MGAFRPRNTHINISDLLTRTWSRPVQRSLTLIFFTLLVFFVFATKIFEFLFKDEDTKRATAPMLTPAGEISLVRESSSDETDEELERIAEEEVGDGLP